MRENSVQIKTWKDNKPFVATVFIAAAFVIAQLIAAVALCRQRLFMDATYYFFHVVNEEAFRVEHQRFILALSQCLLLIGVKMHLSINVLLVIYSVTPVLYSGLLIFISLLYFKSEAAAWLIMLCCVCGNYFLYYCPMYEVCYAVVTFGFLCLLTRCNFYQTGLQAAIYFMVLMVALTGYPLIILGCVALPVYHYLASGKKISYKLAAIYFVAFLIWLAIKYFFISDYEKGKISIEPREYPEIIKGMLTWHFIKAAFAFVFQFYREVLLAAIAFILVSLWVKNYALAALQFFTIVAFVFIVNVGYRGDGLIFSNNFERMYLLLVAAGFGPLLLIAYPGFKPCVKLLCVLLLLVVLVLKSNNVLAHRAFYNRRISLINKMETELHLHCAKVAVNWDSVPPELDQWSTGMEDLIYTSAHGRGCIITDAATLKKDTIDNTHFIIRLNEVMDRKDLNPAYFSLDSSGYCFAKGIDTVARAQ